MTMRPPGVEFNTFTIAARCARTRRLGIGIATRSLAVGTRCSYIKPDVGIVVVQATSNPPLGYLGVKLLEVGYSAPKVLRELEDSDIHLQYRQVAVIDALGHAAAFTGKDNRPWAGHLVKDNHVALGNVLLGEHVVKAMSAAFEAAPDETLEERLLRGVEAGRDAGGQHGGQKSAALLVYGQPSYPEIDLRVDEHKEPVAELRRIFDIYRPLVPYYNLHVTDPRGLPPYDVWVKQQQEQGKTR
jgi:uncharacterized Ntn-hydrolase superfamily protein